MAVVRTVHSRWLLLAFCAFCASPFALAQDGLFADGFEAPAAPACVGGPQSGASLGSAPNGSATTLLCFELREDQGVARDGEPAWGSVAVPRAANLLDAEFNRLVVVGPGARQLPAQFRTIARWAAPLSDSAAPVLWLEISLRPDLPANSTVVLALQRYAQAPMVADPDALSVAAVGAKFLIDTGLAQFTVDPVNPALLERAAIRASAGAALNTVYQYQAGVAGYGLEAALSSPDGTPLISAGNAIAGSLVVDGFEWIEQGPVRAVAHLRGHLQSIAASARCNGDPTYLAFPFSVTVSATRGSRHLDFDWQFVTACSDASGNNWQDQSVRIDALAWNLRVDAGAAASRASALAGAGAVTLRANGDSDRYLVQQRRGAGSPWLRRAEIRDMTTATALETAQSFANPLAAVAGSNAIAAIQAPWLRYREPQGVEVEGDRLAFRFVSEQSLVGEGKGLWFSGRLSLDPPAANPTSVVETRRAQAQAALERGLLPRALLTDLNNSAVLPPLGSASTSAIGNAYRIYLDGLHDQLVRDVPCTDALNFQGGQWTCAKTFGSQLWPDIQLNVQFNFIDNATPNDDEGKHDYWAASNAELTEFLRSGEPRWAWDFALPQVWLQAYTAYLNLGTHDTTNRNGYAPNSGGTGDGLWHRGNFGSSDYSYNMGFGLAYAARPTPALRDRFAQMGASSINLFTNNPLDDTTWTAIGRFNVQHLRGLLYCAQFVPGAPGASCDQRLRNSIDYLAINSISAGIPCQTMLTAQSGCFFGQMFMDIALFYPFLDEIERLYGPTLSSATRTALRRLLIDTPRIYRQYGIPNLGNGQPDVTGDWSSAMQCTLSGAGFSNVSACTLINLPEPYLFPFNRPAATHLWFRSHALDPNNGMCTQGRALVDGLFAGADPLGPLRDFARGGWAKGSAESAQGLAYAVGGYESCVP